MLFRSAELGAAFLDWLHERGLPDAGYRDPGLRPSRAPGRVPAGLRAFARAVLRRIRWTPGDADRFLGEYLTEPKAHVVFERGRGRRALARSVVRLDPRTRLLYSGNRFFLNGESFTLGTGDARRLRALADRRVVPGASLARAPLAGLLSRWRDLGYAHFERS